MNNLPTMKLADIPKFSKKGDFMEKYVCPCGYEYKVAEGDPDNGIAPNTPWENIPEDWVCPICGLGKEEFTKE